MQNFKERLYNYEADPPPEIWDNISAGLEAKRAEAPIHGLRRKSKFIFYGATAAASLIIIFVSSQFFNRTGDKIQKKNSIPSLQTNNVIAQKVIDSLKLNNKTLDAIINSSKDKKELVKNYQNPESTGKKYLTIEGPDCQPVKISPKVATLIESADNDYPPKPVWSKKIERWKQIMLSTTFSPTSTSLLDIAQLSTTLDNNE